MSAIKRFGGWSAAVLGLVVVTLACGPLSQVTQGQADNQPKVAPDGAGAAPALDDSFVQLTGEAQITAVAQTAVAVPAGSLEQWATAAEASSQYLDVEWSANKAVGPPDSDLENCADSRNAWANSDVASESDFLQLTYATPVVPTRIDIYEQNKPGSIVQIEVVDEAGTSQVVYQAQPNSEAGCPRVLSIGVTGVTTRVNGVIIRVDQSFLGSYDEIDAVNLVGNP